MWDNQLLQQNIGVTNRTVDSVWISLGDKLILTYGRSSIYFISLFSFQTSVYREVYLNRAYVGNTN